MFCVKIITIFCLLATWVLTEPLDLINQFHQNDYKIKFGHVEFVSHNETIIGDPHFKSFKFNRTIPAINFTFTLKVEMLDYFYVVVQAYKFLSNEYRPTSARMQLNNCECYKDNVAGIRENLKCGNYKGCPLRKGTTYEVCNFYPDESRFPPLLPNGDFMVEMKHIFEDVTVMKFRGYFTVYRPILPPNRK